jgi:hypothetical protein
MPEELKYTLEEANKYFAVKFNNAIWPLLENPGKTEEENNELINLAHASLLHWSNRPDCKKINLQRGEYMIAIAYTEAKRKESALYYAKRCKEMTDKHPAENDDFDLPYALLALAGALYLNGFAEEADIHLADAKRFGDAIKNEVDKKIFMGDIASATAKFNDL